MNTIKQILKKLGLSENEIAIYLYGSANPPQTVSGLAKHCNINRTTAYDVINSLEQKGLCSNVSEVYGKRVNMLPLFELSGFVAKKKKELDSIELEIKKVTKDIPKKPKYFVEPKVTYFRGVEGVRKLFYSSLQTSEMKVYSALSLDGIFSVLGKDFINDYVKRRVEKNVQSLSIRPTKEIDNGPLYDHNKKHLREIRIKPNDIEINGTFLLWDNCVAFITVHEEPFGTLIQSEDYSSTIKSWFNFVWEKSKKV